MSNRDPLTKTLSQFQLLAPLTPAEIEQVAAVTVSSTHPRGSTLFTQGNPVRGLHLVESGNVKLYNLSPTGQELVLGVVQGGKVAAEWVLFQPTYPMSAQCLAATQTLYLPVDALSRILQANPRMALHWLSTISVSTAKMLTLIEDLTLRDARARVCHYLYSSVEGVISDDGTVIDLPVTQATLASMLGITQETLCRTLRSLRTEGLVARIGSHKIRVENVSGLRQAAVISTPQ